MADTKHTQEIENLKSALIEGMESGPSDATIESIMDEVIQKRRKTPNAETRAAIKEAREGENLNYIDDIDSFMASIDEEE